jgi:hypothetical protein
MRSYQHRVDEEFLNQELAGRWNDDVNRMRAVLGSQPSVEFNLSTALPLYFEGVCFAWALDNQGALDQLRGEITQLVGSTLDTFAPGDIQRITNHTTMAQVGVGAEIDIVRRLAEVVDQRPRGATDERDPHAYRHDLLDGLVTLVIGEDGAAQEASTRIHGHLDHPRTPPTVFYRGLPHAIDAVARRDQTALDDAANFSSERFAHQMSPTRDNPAGPLSLLYPALSLVCRTASWRGMQWPATPYIIPLVDPPVLVP